jgi:hypothetical protein
MDLYALNIPYPSYPYTLHPTPHTLLFEDKGEEVLYSSDYELLIDIIYNDEV